MECIHEQAAKVVECPDLLPFVYESLTTDLLLSVHGRMVSDTEHCTSLGEPPASKPSLSAAVVHLEMLMLAYAQHSEAEETHAGLRLRFQLANASEAILSKAKQRRCPSTSLREIADALYFLYGTVAQKVALRRVRRRHDALPQDQAVDAVLANLTAANDADVLASKQVIISLCFKDEQLDSRKYACLRARSHARLGNDRT